jgi:transposase
MKAYSSDLRLEIVSACERGRRSRLETAELFGVSPATVGRTTRTTMRRALLRSPRKKNRSTRPGGTRRAVFTTEP